MPTDDGLPSAVCTILAWPQSSIPDIATLNHIAEYRTREWSRKYPIPGILEGLAVLYNKTTTEEESNETHDD